MTGTRGRLMEGHTCNAYCAGGLHCDEVNIGAVVDAATAARLLREAYSNSTAGMFAVERVDPPRDGSWDGRARRRWLAFWRG
jgi:hypothetical protein